MNIRRWISVSNLSVGNTGFVVFKYREYRFFWIAAAFSNVGMWALIYGRLWLMHSLTDSPFMVGLTTAASLGPVLLFSIWGGVIADRVNRLQLVRITRSLFGVIAIFTGVLIATGTITEWYLLMLSACTGILLSFDIPSRAAMLPTLVPREYLPSAIALYSLVFGGSAILGPAVFAQLVELWGIEGIFFIVGITYIMTVVSLFLMSTAGHRPTNRPSSILAGLLDGLKYLRQNHAIGVVLLMGITMGIFGSSFQSLLPVLSDKIITGGIHTYSRLLLSEGIGGLFTTGVIAFLGLKVRPAKFYVFAGVFFGLALLALAQMSWLIGAAVAVAIIGATRVVFQTMGTTLMQTLTSDEFRGRIMSLHQFTWGAAALGGLLMGTLGEYLGVKVALSIGGAVVMSVGAIAGAPLLRSVGKRT